MAEFSSALQQVLTHEGGYVNDTDDPGGETYKGIARKMNSKWEGWTIVDLLKKESSFPSNLDKSKELQQQIEDFYRINFWDIIKADDIVQQEVAFSIFDFAVNAGISTSISLAQSVVGATVDGVSGKQTVAKINDFDTELFLASFTVLKIARYVNIVKKRPTSQKYFYGWVRRALGDYS